MRHPVRRTMMRTACAAMLPLVLAACGTRDDAASITADLRAQMDGSKVCAVLVAPEWPIEQSAEHLASPGIEALIAADLIRREPVVNRANVTPQARISITETGTPYLQLEAIGPGSPPSPYLCFGRKQITSISRGEDGVVRYRYRIVDPPAWALRSDMRTVFPFLARLIDHEQHAELGAVKEDGRWQVPGGPMQTNLAELGNIGFLPCPYPNASPDEDPCR